MVADWVPALPQVPVTMGMKKARATIWCSTEALSSMMVVDNSEVNNSSANHMNRLQKSPQPQRAC